MPNLKIADPKSCQCGEVLKGVIKPQQCKVFGTACTPETPLGALMVSSRGRVRGLPPVSRAAIVSATLRSVA